MKLLKTILKFVVFFLAWALLVAFLPIPGESGLKWRFYAELIPLLVLVVLSFLFWLFERREVPVLSLHHPIRSILWGGISGVVWLGLAVALAVVFRVMQFSPKTHVDYLWIWILCCLINVIMQELLVRGYLYQMIRTSYNTVAAVIVTSLLFTVLHGFDSGVVSILNAFTTSIVLSLIMISTGSLLSAILMHGVWNCVGGILLGCIVLTEDYPSVLHPTFTGSVLLSGGTSLLEGSLFVLVLNLLLILFFAFRIRAKNRNQNRRRRRRR